MFLTKCHTAFISFAFYADQDLKISYYICQLYTLLKIYKAITNLHSVPLIYGTRT